MATNIATSGASTAAITARNAQYTGTPFTDTDGSGTYADPYLGCNRAGGNNCGIGIETANVHVPAGGAARPEGWTELDQAGNAREGQDTGTIGHINAASDADPTGTPHTPAVFGILHADVANADYNDEAYFLAATNDAVAVDGVVDTPSGAVNKTGGTVAVGDIGWFPVPNA